MSEPTEVRPRVVHLAGNEITVDARVLKYLATTSALGLDTVAVGVARGGSGSDRRIDGVRIVVVGVPRGLRTALRARLGQVGVVLRPGYRGPDEREAAQAQLRRWRGRLAGRSGPAALLARAGVATLAVVSRLLALVPRAAVDQDPQARAARVTALVAGGRARWRTIHPVAARDTTALAPVLADLEPALLHVHDVYLLAAAVTFARRSRAAGRPVVVVYDAHEYVPGVAAVPEREVAGWADLEREFLPEVDRVITVSEPLADLLVREHHLSRRPAVVLNAPVPAPWPADPRTVRDVAGLDAGVPLLVYGGGVNSARGVDTAVDALADLPGVHLVLVTAHHNYVVEALVGRAARLGVGERFHLAPYVAAQDVPAYLSGADVGLSTLLPAPNHDVAVTNKFCEYLQAGLPVVTSDTPAQADLVRELDLGAVYPAGDAAGLAAAVRAALADGTRLRDRIAQDAQLRARFAWPAQAAVVRRTYAELLDLPAVAWDPAALQIERLPGS